MVAGKQNNQATDLLTAHTASTRGLALSQTTALLERQKQQALSSTDPLLSETAVLIEDSFRTLEGPLQWRRSLKLPPLSIRAQVHTLRYRVVVVARMSYFVIDEAQVRSWIAQIDSLYDEGFTRLRTFKLDIWRAVRQTQDARPGENQPVKWVAEALKNCWLPCAEFVVVDTPPDIVEVWHPMPMLWNEERKLWMRNEKEVRGNA